jgi:SPP1 family predicted phage head-tail adaptor
VAKSARPQPNPLYLNPGDLRHPIQLATRNSSQDAFGQPLIAWAVYRSTIAMIRLLSGQEMFQASQFTSAAQYRITIRWTSQEVKVGDRIFYGAHTYVVQIVDNVLMRNFVVNLTCLEIDGGS